MVEIEAFNDIELKDPALQTSLPSGTLTFVTSCAERLLPAYGRFLKQVQLDPETGGLFDRGIETIWESFCRANSAIKKEIEEMAPIFCSNKVHVPPFACKQESHMQQTQLQQECSFSGHCFLVSRNKQFGKTTVHTMLSEFRCSICIGRIVFVI